MRDDSSAGQIKGRVGMVPSRPLRRQLRFPLRAGIRRGAPHCGVFDASALVGTTVALAHARRRSSKNQLH